MLIDHPLTFAGGEYLPIHVQGRFLRVRKATASVYISIDGGPELERQLGEQINIGRDATKIVVRSVVAQSVILTAAEEHQSDDRASINATVSTTIEAGNDNNHLPKVNVPATSTVLLAAANTNRKSLRVSLLSSAAGYVLLGKSGVTAAQGGTIEEGMVDYIDTTGALYVYNPNAVAVDVYCLEINKI